MNGCRWQEKSFSVTATDDRGKDFCSKCTHTIDGTIYKKNGDKMCKACFDLCTPDKEFGTNGADLQLRSPYYDQQLGTTITNLRQKEKLLEKKGLHYSEDNPKFRELRKMSESYLGKDGRRSLDDKAKAEFTKLTQNMAHKKYEV